MDDVSSLGRMESQKTKGDTAVARQATTFRGWFVHWTLRNWVEIALLFFPPRPASTPRLAVGAVALQSSTMLWFPAAALLLEVDGRRGTVLALACVELAAAVVDHCIATWHMGLMLVAAQGDSHFLLLCLFVAAGVILFAVVDLRGFLALLRGVGLGEEE